jgi:protein SCO1/2
VTLVFFGYTNCPDVCGLVMADIATALSRLEPAVAADVQMLFITTDPARDTGPVLRSYLDHFNPSFEGLTGSMHDIRTVATALGVPVEGIQRLPDGGYDVGHGSQIVGLDAADEAPVVWTEGTPVSDLEHDITVLDRQA